MLRRWLGPRALLLHLLLVVVAGGCLIAGWWQLHRALGGNGLSWFYTFEWPVFAGFAGFGWWQLLHEPPKARLERRRERHQDRHQWQAVMRGELTVAPAVLVGAQPADDAEQDPQARG